MAVALFLAAVASLVVTDFAGWFRLGRNTAPISASPSCCSSSAIASVWTARPECRPGRSAHLSADHSPVSREGASRLLVAGGDESAAGDRGRRVQPRRGLRRPAGGLHLRRTRRPVAADALRPMASAPQPACFQGASPLRPRKLGQSPLAAALAAAAEPPGFTSVRSATAAAGIGLRVVRPVGPHGRRHVF